MVSFQLLDGECWPFSLKEWSVSTEANAQCESYELSFIWGKMRTAAQEAAGDSVAKILALCASVPNRNMETEL